MWMRRCWIYKEWARSNKGPPQLFLESWKENEVQTRNIKFCKILLRFTKCRVFTTLLQRWGAQIPQFFFFTQTHSGQWSYFTIKLVTQWQPKEVVLHHHGFENLLFIGSKTSSNNEFSVFVVHFLHRFVLTSYVGYSSRYIIDFSVRVMNSNNVHIFCVRHTHPHTHTSISALLSCGYPNFGWFLSMVSNSYKVSSQDFCTYNKEQKIRQKPLFQKCKNK